MALYKVDSDTADLTKVAGGTLYADLPIGSWIKNDMDTIPSGFLKEGDTISQSEYPELYAKYGSTVPYMADTSELSAYENITLSTNSSNPTVMPYDGVYILANYGVSYIHHIYLNGVEISAGITGNSTTGASTSSTILFKKGDTMYRLNTYTESTFLEHVAYYKKSLIIKAKHTPVPADLAPVDIVESGNMKAVTSNAVFDEVNKIRNTQIVIGTSRTVTVQRTMAERWSANLSLPTIPDGKKVLRWFAVVLSQAANTNGCATVGYMGSSGIPDSIITVPDNDGTMEIAYAAEIF